MCSTPWTVERCLVTRNIFDWSRQRPHIEVCTKWPASCILQSTIQVMSCCLFKTYTLPKQHCFHWGLFMKVELTIMSIRPLWTTCSDLRIKRQNFFEYCIWNYRLRKVSGANVLSTDYIMYCHVLLMDDNAVMYRLHCKHYTSIGPPEDRQVGGGLFNCITALTYVIFRDEEFPPEHTTMSIMGQSNLWTDGLSKQQ